ncbi:MAG: hypothetical protein V3S29_03795 [bacterium]
MKRTLNKLVALVWLLALAAPLPALAYEKYGNIPPDGPFHLWLGINEFMPLLTANSSKARAIRAVKAKRFRGKTPGAVLGNVVRFRNKLNRVLAKYRLDKTREFRSPTGEKVSPSIVYINAGHVYDSVVGVLLEANPKNQTYREIFLIPYPKGKTPSDVFELVDLAIRKLDLLL